MQQKAKYADSAQNQDEQDLVNEVTSQFLLAKRYLDVIHQRMNEQEELYRTYIDKNNYPHSARVFDPRVFRVIETIVPRMVSNEPTGSFYPSEDGDVVVSNILKALIRYDWRRAEMFPKLVLFIKSMLIFGTAFGRTHWDYRTSKRPRMVPKEINGKNVWTPTNKEFVEIVDFDGPNFEALNIYDCFPDPNSTNLANMRWFIYRTYKTLDELKKENDVRGGEHYKNLEILEEAIEHKKKQKKSRSGVGGGQASDNQFREHRRIMLSTQEFRGEDESSPEFVILRRFTREGWVDIVPEYGVAIRDIDNPYFHGELPIVYGVDYPYPGELYGMGEIEPIDRIQRAINAVLNQRLDNVQLTLRTMWKVQKGKGVDLHTLVSAPGNVITTSDMNAVEPVQVPDVTGATFVQTMNYLTSALQNGSAITDYTIGLNTSRNTANETATGTRLIQQEANAQFKLKIQLLNHMVLEKVVNQWKDLRIQYTTESQKLRIIGKDEVEYLRENTKLSQVDLEGKAIAPGDLETNAKLQISEDGSFAFLNLIPDDIQPSIVGNYDFIAAVSSDQLNDPVALQENFFIALDKVKDPNWQEILARQGKMLNAASLTKKVFDKLSLGIEEKDTIIDIPTPQQTPMPGQPNESQPVPPEMMEQMVAEPVQNPIQNPLQQPQGGMEGGMQNQPMTGGMMNG